MHLLDEGTYHRVMTRADGGLHIGAGQYLSSPNRFGEALHSATHSDWISGVIMMGVGGPQTGVERQVSQ